MKDWKKKADTVRALSLISTTEAGSGHPTSAMSAADLATVLFDKYFTYDLANPKNPNNDKFVLSKGHASPLLYSLFALTGAIKRKDLLTLRKFGSVLEGHPTPRFPHADVTTGSLGQGLSVGAGMAYIGKHENLPGKVYVLLGDGELAEGQIFEACNFAYLNKLDNLIAIADINGLGQTGKTAFYHNTEHYNKVFSALGFETRVIDGHNFTQIESAFETAFKNKSGKPFIIIARTEKGKGVSFLEGVENYHGKAVKKEELDKALSELGLSRKIIESDEVLFRLKSPKPIKSPKPKLLKTHPALEYKLGQEVATREAFGDALVAVGSSNPDIYAIDGDVGNSTYTEKFAKNTPSRFVQAYIEEQNMVGVAIGFSAKGKIPFVATFGAFLTRAYDQIRMGAISGANIKFVGSHAGVSIGEDGPSQMALEDIAMFAPFPGSVILHPSDAVSCAKLVVETAKHKGVSYLRTLRAKTPVLYRKSDTFKIGGSKILKQSSKDVLTIAACGITVFEALKAYEELEKLGIMVRIIDCYSVKPVDTKTLEKAVQETKKPILITVEDHFQYGGLGDIVSADVNIEGAKHIKMAVNKIMQSGKPDELLDYAGISAKHIVKKVKSLI